MSIQLRNWSKWVHRLTKGFQETLKWLKINNSKSWDRVERMQVELESRRKRTVSRPQSQPPDMFIWAHALWRMTTITKWRSLAKQSWVKKNRHLRSSIKSQDSIEMPSLWQMREIGRSSSHRISCIWILNVKIKPRKVMVTWAQGSEPWQSSRREARQ